MPRNRIIKYLLCFLGILILSASSFFRIFETYELQTLDLRFKLRPALKINPDIVIIEIAEDSIKELGSWPIKRQYYADLINYLGQLGARAIVFDTLFGDKTPDDKYLIEETGRSPGSIYYPVVLKLDVSKDRGRQQASGIEIPVLESLAKAAKGVGFINVVADSDGKIRRAPLSIECGGKKYFQLACLAARDYLGRESFHVPVDPVGDILINYPGKWNNSFKRYSLVDILASFEQKVAGEKGRIALDGFYNKVCFVGVTAPGGHDLKADPLERAYPMVGVHASIFNSIVQNKFLTRAGKSVNLIFLFALCLVIAVIANRARPLSGLGICAGIIFSFILTGFILFILFGLWIDLFCPIVLAAAVYTGFTVNRYLIERRNSFLMERELSVAKKIQTDFLPSSVPQIKGLYVAVSIETAKAVGGDLYDFADFAQVPGERKIGIMIGDVSGKGVPAALFMARSIADFRHLVNTGRSPSSLLGELNKEITLNYKTGLFITMFYMIYDASNRDLTFSSAGHPPALLLKADGSIDSLKTEGVPLGLIDTEVYSDVTVRLSPGDAVILYTDGVTEARNSHNEEFGEGRLKDAILKNKGLPAGSMLNEIKAWLDKFAASRPQYDDCTIIILKVKE